MLAYLNLHKILFPGREQNGPSIFNMVKLLLIYGLFTKGTLTIESEHPVFETRYAHRFVFIPKEHNHGFQPPTFRETVSGKKKRLWPESEITDRPSSERSNFRGIYYGN